MGRYGPARPADRGRHRSRARRASRSRRCRASLGAGVNFGVTAAKALEERKIDGFWANGMGAEVAVRRGIGTVVLDVRRGDGPKPCFNYTAATIATTDALIARSPDTAAAAVRAIVKTQAALKADVSRAAEVGRRLFPPSEAELIAELIRRDLPYYDATLSREFVAGMTDFCAAKAFSTATCLRERRRHAVRAAVARLRRQSFGRLAAKAGRFRRALKVEICVLDHSAQRSTGGRYG